MSIEYLEISKKHGPGYTSMLLTAFNSPSGPLRSKGVMVFMVLKSQ